MTVDGRISLVMIVKNEEANLGRCLESVKGIVDEIVVVDTGSTDATKIIADSFNAVVYDFTWSNDFSAARNFGLEKATGAIRLILDADEYVVAGTRDDLLQTAEQNCIGKVAILNAFEKDGEVKYSRDYISRICPDNVRYTGKIHEQLESNLERKKTNIEIMHDGYLNKDKSERNLEILFEEIKMSPKDSYLMYQIAHTLFLAGRKEKAASWYQKYYQVSDVRESYRCSAIVDYLYNLVAIGDLQKAFDIVQKEKDRYKDSPDFNFVCGEFYREFVLANVEKNIKYLPYIEESYIRCLEIGDTTEYDTVVGTGSFLAAYNLGAWYEVSGQIDKAKQCYEAANEWGYTKAIERLKVLG